MYFAKKIGDFSFESFHSLRTSILSPPICPNCKCICSNCKMYLSPTNHRNCVHSVLGLAHILSLAGNFLHILCHKQNPFYAIQPRHHLCHLSEKLDRSSFDLFDFIRHMRPYKLVHWSVSVITFVFVFVFAIVYLAVLKPCIPILAQSVPLLEI